METRNLIRWTSIVVVLSFAYWWSNRTIQYPNFIVINQEPIQTPENIEFSFKEFEIKAVATYDITARIIGKSKYNFGMNSDLAPWDLALGWQEMSKQENINKIDCFQTERFAQITSRAFKREWMVMFSNNHIIPATSDIKDTIAKVHVGEAIHLTGYLVNVWIKSKPGWHWNTSTTRSDTGDGACEIIFAKSIEILSPVSVSRIP